MKKTFLDSNPALQFISTEPLPNPIDVSIDDPLVTDVFDVVTAIGGSDLPIEHHSGSIHAETRSRRVQLLLRPSLFEQLNDAAKASGVSFNSFVHAILDDALAPTAP